MKKEEFTQRILAAEPTLYHVSRSILNNACDCEDAVQEAITTAWDKLGSLRDERYFKTWLCRILIHACYRILHQQEKVVPFETYMEPAAPPGEDTALYEAVTALPQELRLVVVLHYIDGFQIGELAEILKIPEGTVKSRMSRARSRLRSALEEKEALCYDHS